MRLPAKISHRGVKRSEAVDRFVRERIARLERFAGDLVRCEVSIERPHHAHRQGDLFRVRVHLTSPRGEVIVGRSPEDHAHEDVLVAARDAFRAARRKLVDAASRA